MRSGRRCYAGLSLGHADRHQDGLACPGSNRIQDETKPTERREASIDLSGRWAQALTCDSGWGFKMFFKYIGAIIASAVVCASPARASIVDYALSSDGASF